MLYAYTAVITESDGIFYAKVPDIDGCITTGNSLPEAISLITDALNLCLVGLEDEDICPKPPTSQADIPHTPDDILTIIQADTILYRARTCLLYTSSLADLTEMHGRFSDLDPVFVDSRD